MNKLIGILMLCVAAMGAACSGGQSDEPQSAPEQSAPMTFRTIGADAQSRCAQSPDADAQSPNADGQSRCATGSRGDTENALGNQFAVFAWKTNAKGNNEYVMSKDNSGTQPYIVSYTDGQGWHYADLEGQYLKYWDESAKDYTFYAIANYSSYTHSFLSGYCSINGIDISDPNSLKLMESHYKRDGSAMADYDLIDDPTAAEVYNTPTAKGSTPAYADIVPLPFHYLLSQVQFKIYNKSPQSGISIPVNHVTIKINDSDGFYTQGNYSNLAFDFTASMLKQTVFIDNEVTDMEITSSKKNAVLLSECYVLPQTLNLSAEVTIDTEKGTLKGAVDLAPGWGKSKIYIYYLYIEYSEDLILVDTVEIDDWIPGATVSNTQTNW